MAALHSILINSWNYFLTIRFTDVLDILIVAFLIYKLIGLIRKTNSMRLAKGIIVLLIILWLSGIFNLTMINYILRSIYRLCHSKNITNAIPMSVRHFLKLFVS